MTNTTTQLPVLPKRERQKLADLLTNIEEKRYAPDVEVLKAIEALDSWIAGLLLERDAQWEKKLEKERRKAYEAWWYITDRDYLIDVDMAMVNPLTGLVDPDMLKNTKLEYWIEAGQMSEDGQEHDIRLDCGGDSIEEALIEMARRIKSLTPAQKEKE